MTPGIFHAFFFLETTVMSLRLWMAIIQYIAITTSQKEGKLGSIIPNFRPKHGNLLQVKKISEFFPLFFQKTTFSF